MKNKVCWYFVLGEFFIVIIGRFMGVFGAYYLLQCCSRSAKGSNNHLSCKELTFIAYAALIRGAIAFGLVINIGEDTLEDKDIREVLVSSTLMLVILTTVIFGTFTSTM